MVARMTRSKSENQLPMIALLPPGDAMLPEDFPRRLEQVHRATGLSWNALAEKLGVDPRQVARWRNGSEPTGGAMLALVRLARRIPGGIDTLLDNHEG